MLPIESIRHPLEDELGDVLVETFGPFKVPEHDNRSLERLEMTALELEPGSRPYELLVRAVDVLELPGPFRLFQTSGEEWNAGIYWQPDSTVIALVGDIARKLDDEALLAVLGHEVGHALAHQRLEEVLPYQVLCELSTERYPSEWHERRGRLARVVRLLREVTADRFGLLAVAELDAALRVNLVSATGLATDALPVSEASYLRQVRAAVTRFRQRGDTSQEWSHPEAHLRAYASWRFSRSDLFRELSGRGPGTCTLAEANTQVSELLVSEPEVSAFRRMAQAAGFVKPKERQIAAVGDEPPARPASPKETKLGGAMVVVREVADLLANAALDSLSDAPPVAELIEKPLASARRLARRVAKGAPRERVEATAVDDVEEEDPFAAEEAALLRRFEELERQLGKR
ncbi:MAG: M48 family metalloprotease [Myxococcota bacterium]